MITLSSCEQDELLEREDMTVHKSLYAYSAYEETLLHGDPVIYVSLLYNAFCPFA